MAWTAPVTRAAADYVDESDWNEQIVENFKAINGFVRKTADEDVTSSAALQNDNELLYTIGATGTYIAKLVLFVTSAANAAGDINLGFSFPTGTLSYGAFGLDSSLASGFSGTFAAQAVTSATSGVTAIGLGASTATNMIVIETDFVATATGTLQFMWSQNTSNANKTTVKAGSFMKVKQVA